MKDIIKDIIRVGVIILLFLFFFIVIKLSNAFISSLSDSDLGVFKTAFFHPANTVFSILISGSITGVIISENS